VLYIKFPLEVTVVPRLDAVHGPRESCSKLTNYTASHGNTVTVMRCRN